MHQHREADSFARYQKNYSRAEAQQQRHARLQGTPPLSSISTFIFRGAAVELALGRATEKQQQQHLK
jgi:hypothetical protein